LDFHPVFVVKLKGGIFFQEYLIMKTRLRGSKAAKLSAICAASLIAVFGLTNASSDAVKVSASASGPTPSHTNAPGEANCTACHTSFPVNSGTGSITITGLPANYRAGQSIPITVTTSQADGIIYGFQLTAIDSRGLKVGAYTLPPANPAVTQVVPGLVGGMARDYIEHTSDGVVPTQFGSKSWTFNWNAPAVRAGKVSFYAAGNAANSDGGPDGDYIYTRSGATLSGSAISNFDADVKSDVAVFRPSSGVWYAANSSNGVVQSVQFGLSGDKITPGDFDGDGITDLAVWRPSTGVWYVQKSTGGYLIGQFGLNGDVPVQADYDGDLKTDVAVWRPSTGVWYIQRTSDGTYDIRQFGISTDKTAQGDFDGDGKADVAVWRPSTGVWYVWRSTDFGYSIFAFGLNGDLPVQGDYDSDGKTDAAVFRPSNGVWYLLRSLDGFGAAAYGIATDKPVPADFDGDGKTDIAVFRNGVWYILRSSDGLSDIFSFGLSGDVPVPTGYISE
jgi:hypothetical protein